MGDIVMTNYIKSLCVNIIEPNDTFKWIFYHGNYYVNANYEQEFSRCVHRLILKFMTTDHFKHIPDLSKREIRSFRLRH